MDNSEVSACSSPTRDALAVDDLSQAIMIVLAFLKDKPFKKGIDTEILFANKWKLKKKPSILFLNFNISQQHSTETHKNTLQLKFKSRPNLARP